MMIARCATVISALLFSHALAHSQMSWPESTSSQTCRMGGEPQFSVLNCRGPCDLAAIREGKANFDSPDKPAATFRRGQTYAIKYQRNNHPPGGFIRITMVTPDKMMDKREHAKNAFYYSCWGANAVKAGPDELDMQQYGFSMVGTDASQHDLAPGYYTTNVKIPAVIPDGDYVFGWTWYGGTGGGEVENDGPATKEPEPWGYFSDYWSCSYVRVEGGAPLASEHTPIFNNDMPQFSSEGCMSANDALGVCTYEPCRVTGKYQKPREFKNGRVPRPLTPGDFGGVGSKSGTGGSPTQPPPMTEPAAPMTEPVADAPEPNPQEKILLGRRSCRCIANGEKCWQTLADRTSGYCNAFTGSYDQPTMCKEMCCSHCENRRKGRLCQNDIVKSVCGM